MIYARRGHTQHWRKLEKTPKWFRTYALSKGARLEQSVEFASYANTYDEQGRYYFSAGAEVYTGTLVELKKELGCA